MADTTGADCRLIRTAIRRGWLNDAPQVDRDALVARFEQASAERQADDPQNVRALLAECKVLIEMHNADLDPVLRRLRYSWAGEWTDRTTGRPRRRRYVSDYVHRLDANEVRRRMNAEGTDLRTLVGAAIDVRIAERPDYPGERIALAVTPDARYGWRIWLVCPGAYAGGRTCTPHRLASGAVIVRASGTQREASDPTGRSRGVILAHASSRPLPVPSRMSGLPRIGTSRLRAIRGIPILPIP